MPDSDKNHLISRIDELEMNWKSYWHESQRAQTSKLNVGTDGIPVLIEAVVEEDIDPNKAQTLHALNKDDQVINDIINTVYKEITGDLDE